MSFKVLSFFGGDDGTLEDRDDERNEVETRRDSGEVRSVDYGTVTEVGSVRIEFIAGISEVSQILGAFLVSKR